MELGGIEKYKNKIINIAVIVLAVIIAVNIYKNHVIFITALNSQKQKEIEKNEIITNIIKLQKEFNAYKSLINGKDVSLAINNLNIIAKGAGVKINSIKPEQTKIEGIYETYSFQLEISAQNYENVGNFISSLESDPMIFIIDSMKFKPQKEEVEIGGTRKKVVNVLNIDLRISTNLLR